METDLEAEMSGVWWGSADSFPMDSQYPNCPLPVAMPLPPLVDISSPNIDAGFDGASEDWLASLAWPTLQPSQTHPCGGSGSQPEFLECLHNMALMLPPHARSYSVLTRDNNEFEGGHNDSELNTLNPSKMTSRDFDSLTTSPHDWVPTFNLNNNESTWVPSPCDFYIHLTNLEELDELNPHPSSFKAVEVDMLQAVPVRATPEPEAVQATLDQLELRATATAHHTRVREEFLSCFTVPFEDAFLRMRSGLNNDRSFLGLRSLHLMVGCLEAVCSDNQTILEVLLDRLMQIVSYNGGIIERVACYFIQGFQMTLPSSSRTRVGLGADPLMMIREEHLMGAFQVLYTVYPYIRFAHFAANQALLEAVEGEQVVHVVDYDIMEGLQWSSFMVDLVNRAGGPPQLQITAFNREHSSINSLGSVEATGRRLTDLASDLRIPFVFTLSDLSSESWPTSCGGTMVVNCMVHLPHMSPDCKHEVQAFLARARMVHPKVLTIAEERLWCANPDPFHDFFQGLKYYCGLMESLEATLTDHDIARALVERYFFSQRIESMVVSFCSRAQRNRLGLAEMRETASSWSSLAKGAGFSVCPVSSTNRSMMRSYLQYFECGYSCVEDMDHRLILLWKEQPMLAISAWNSNSTTR